MTAAEEPFAGLGRNDPAREPFAEGIDPRVLARGHREGAQTHPADRREQGPGADVSRLPWPPPSSGPMPPPDGLPPDLNVYTAQDEIDAWALEHDWCVERLAEARTALMGDPADRQAASLQGRLNRKRDEKRDEARRDARMTGRKNASDIDVKTDRLLEDDPDRVVAQHRALTGWMDTLRDRMFAAKLHIARLQKYIDSLPRLGEHRP